MFRRLILLAATFLLFAAVALSVGFLFVQRAGDQVLVLPEETTLLPVSRGDTLSRLTTLWQTEGFLSQGSFQRRQILLYARFHDLDRILAGEYRIKAGTTVRELLIKLNAGDVIEYQVTFPEGYNLRQWLEQLRQHSRFSHVSDEEAARWLDSIKDKYALDNLEGWFFPDTYSFTGVDSGDSVLAQAHEKMRSVLAQEWAERADDLPYEIPYEALIMASIVERETGAPEERQQIAGVFVRRLNKGMRLQTDPTVIYGLGEGFNGNITRRDLRKETPYNTYVIKGLPPTPIAMPGREAIHAALHPDDGDTLFFVAKGDGSHYFSATYEEHSQAVKRYQLRRRSDYRSAPANKN
jgi:UPF0755 protein